MFYMYMQSRTLKLLRKEIITHSFSLLCYVCLKIFTTCTVENQPTASHNSLGVKIAWISLLIYSIILTQWRKFTEVTKLIPEDTAYRLFEQSSYWKHWNYWMCIYENTLKATKHVHLLQLPSVPSSQSSPHRSKVTLTQRCLGIWKSNLIHILILGRIRIFAKRKWAYREALKK